MRLTRKPVAHTALESNINVTPLVDVCLVLLIIFMVVTPAIVEGIPIELADSKTAAAVEQEKKQLAVSVKEDGTYYVGGVVLRREQLQSEIAAAAAADPTRHVIVRVDRRAAYGNAMDVMRLFRDAGFREVSLATKRATALQ